jgi:uncharacterized membrane protein
MDLLLRIILASVTMALLDFVWLGFVAKKFYYSEIGSLLRDRPNKSVALLFYLIYAVAVVVFVVNPAIDKSSLMHCIEFGGFFGVAAYATYDLTNLATLKDFSVKVTAVDIIWGTIITAVVAAITYTVAT